MSANTGGVGRAIVIGCICLAVAHVVATLVARPKPKPQPRYELKTLETRTFRIDHWTGKTWWSDKSDPLLGGTQKDWRRISEPIGPIGPIGDRIPHW